MASSNSKPKRRWIRIIIILIILIGIVGVVATLNRATVSRLTHGVIFGTHLETLTAEELLSDQKPAPVSDAQREAFKDYSQSVYDERYRKLDNDKRQIVDEMRAVNRMVARANAGKIKITQDNAESLFQEILNEIKNDSGNSFWSKLIPSAWAAVVDDAQAIEAVTLHNMAVGMMLDGHYDLSLVLAALSAAENPQNASTATLLANLLRQSDNDHDALKLLLFALQQEPENEAILVTLGMLYLDLDRVSDARRAFNKALKISGGGGPANQGMMLVSLAEGDMGGAYLYMLEGAKEGYTSLITQTYNHFIRLAGGYKQYLDFAGPILDQYGYEHLTDFKRTRLAFDPTLDTVGQQIMADRTLVLPSTAPQVISSAGIALSAALDHMTFLFKTMFSDIDLEGVVSENGIDFGKLLESESFQSMFEGTGIDPTKWSKNLQTIQNNIDSEGNIDVTGLLGGLITGSNDGKNAEKVTYGEQNYEQEVFWLNILYDYTYYKYNKLTDQYYVKPAETYFNGAIEKSMDELTKKTDLFAKKFESNPIGGLVAMLTNMIDNGSPIADKKYTEDQVNKMSERFCPFNPIMKEGYKEAIMLAEHYWLVTNNILGLIADNKIYNTQHARRNTLAASVLSYFPMAAGISNAMIGLLSNFWGGLTFSGHMNNTEFKTSLEKYVKQENATAKFPKVTEFPITGMGKELKPKLIVRIDVPRPQDVAATAQKVYKDKKGDDATQPGVQDDDAGMCIVLRPGHDTMADVFLTDDGQGQSVMPDQPAAQPESTTTLEDIDEAIVKPGISVKLSKLFTLQQDTTTGKTEIGIGWVVGGIKGGFDPKSGDLYLYGHAGADGAADLEAGAVSIQGVGGKLGLFLKGTVNVYKMSVESADIGGEMEVHLGSTSMSTAVSYDPILSVKRDTATRVINGKGQRLTTETKI